MSRFRPYLDILPSAQQALWPELAPSVALGLVLYGGTAIGLRLGHRPSVDFDFFTDKPLHRGHLHEAFRFLKQAVVIQEQTDTLTVLSPSRAGNEGVKISFFGNLSFGRIGEPQMTEDGILNVASLDDLLATKLKVLLQRIEAKDYKDVAALIAAGVSLEGGLAGASAMYGPAFQANEALKALVYFEGGDLGLLSNQERETLIVASQRVRELKGPTMLRRLSLANEKR